MKFCKKGELIVKLKYWFGQEKTKVIFKVIFNDMDYIIEQEDQFVYIYEKVTK